MSRADEHAEAIHELARLTSQLALIVDKQEDRIQALEQLIAAQQETQPTTH